MCTGYISITSVQLSYRFRSYSESLLSNSHKRNQKGLAPTFGLRCAQVPSLRSRSEGTPRRAILGPTRLSRHPCRSTLYAEPALGLPKGACRSRSRSTACAACSVAVAELCEATSDCAAIVKPESRIYQEHCAVWFYDAFVAGRSLAKIVNDDRCVVVDAFLEV